MKNNEINIEINGQEIICTNSYFFVEKSINYINVIFHFSKEWEGLKIKGSFSHKNYTKEIELSYGDSNPQLVPVEVILAPGFTISCYGELYDGEELKQRITTSTIDIPLKLSGPLEENLSPLPSYTDRAIDLARNNERKIVELTAEIEKLKQQIASQG
jgi:hypothetical protein